MSGFGAKTRRSQKPVLVGAKGEMIQISRGGLLKSTIIYPYTMLFVVIILSTMSKPIC